MTTGVDELHQMQRRRRPFGPWEGDHIARLLIGNAGALLLVATAWWQIAGALSLRVQLTWFVVVLAGLVMSGVTNALWLLRGTQAVSGGRDAVLPDLFVAGRSEPDDTTLVTLPGSRRVHRSNCGLVAGKHVQTHPRTPEGRPDLRACEVCEPHL